MGGKRPTWDQTEARIALVAWLVGVLSSMPLDQSLRSRNSPATAVPLARTAGPMAAEATAGAPEAAATSEKMSGDVSNIREADVRRRDDDNDGVSAEERVRRRMREEARSSVLRALATVLTGCDDEVRRAAATATSAAAGDEAVAIPQVTTRGGERECTAPAHAPAGSTGSCADVTVCDTTLQPPPPPSAEPETRLVPLCLMLLWGCGGAAEPKAGVSGESPAAAGRAPPNVAMESAPFDEGVGRAGVPAGRKADLLKVIGNACFRCRAAQDLVREVGGLPLVLNHCAVDGANPLLR